MARTNSTKIVSHYDVRDDIVHHYDVLSRELSAVKAILAKALTALDHPEAEPQVRHVDYWRNRLNHAIGLVELADNDADLIREAALEATATLPDLHESAPVGCAPNVVLFPLKP